MKFLISLDGARISNHEERLLTKSKIGGVVLFGKNILSSKTTKKLISDIKSINPSLLICIDEEGGSVSRIQHFFPSYSQPYCGTLPLFEITEYYRKRSEVLKQLGFDMNLAPVVDIAIDESSVMYERSYGAAAEKIIELSKICLDEQKRAGILSCIKHFPGHGRVSIDSHKQTPIIDYDFRNWNNIEGKTFRELIHFGVDCVMVGHLIFPNIDPDIATYSSFWVNTVLRKQLHFTGKIISDDLSMKGLPKLESKELKKTLNQVNFDLVIVTDKNHNALKTV